MIVEAKDVLSLLISVLAFLLSSFALWRSSNVKRSEDRRLARTQLSDVLAEISNNDVEYAKVYHEHGRSDIGFVQAVSSILNTRNVHMIQQARFWLAQIPELVTPADFAALASACNNAWDLSTAEEMQQLAIERSKTGYEKATMLRMYGNMLFNRGRNAEARQQFEASVRQMNTIDDAARYTNGYTYLTWGWNERNSARPELAELQFNNAEAEFKLIQSESMRTTAIAYLQSTRQHPGAMPSAPQAAVEPGHGTAPA
jgi:hypothetical protein